MNILSQINWVDVVAIILIVRISYASYSEGFTKSIFPLIGSAAVIVTSLRYYAVAGQAISGNLYNFSISTCEFVSFVLIALITAAIFKLLNVLISKILKVQWHPLIEKFGGLAIGILRSALIVCLILSIFALIPVSYFQRSVKDRSVSGYYFLRIGTDLYGVFARFLPSLNAGSAPTDKEDLLNGLTRSKPVPAQPKKPPVK